MNKIRRKILKCLYDAKKGKPTQSWPFVYIKNHTNIDIKRIDGETDYLAQKGYITKEFARTPSFVAYCKITAQGIDYIESNIFFKIIKQFRLVIVVLIPLLSFYLDFFGLKTKFFALFTGKHQPLVTTEESVIPLPTQETQDSQKETQQKIVKVQINRIIEDAAFWLEERIKQNMSEIEKIKNNFASRNMSYSGAHITAHIHRVNSFINSVNDYLKEVNRKIEDMLLNPGEDKLESVDWLKDEYKKYTDFIEKTKTAKNSVKQQNDGVCLRYADKPIFDNILKANPYID